MSTNEQKERLRQGNGTFGDAIEALKNGSKVCRIGWNGANMFAYYIPENKYPAQTEIAKKAFPEGMVPYRAYIALKTAQNDIATWSPSGSDALAEDWMILEDEVVTLAESEEMLNS